MSEIEPLAGEIIVVPVTGEVINLNDPSLCLRVLGEIRDLESRLREAKAELTCALQVEFTRQGKKTLEVGDVKAELRGGTEVIWDIEVLDRLREMGLPEERMDELVKAEVTYKVNAAVAKQLAAANPEYAAVIELARTTIPKAAYVKITGG